MVAWKVWGKGFFGAVPEVSHMQVSQTQMRTGAALPEEQQGYAALPERGGAAAGLPKSTGCPRAPTCLGEQLPAGQHWCSRGAFSPLGTVQHFFCPWFAEAFGR